MRRCSNQNGAEKIPKTFIQLYSLVGKYSRLFVYVDSSQNLTRRSLRPAHTKLQDFNIEIILPVYYSNKI